MSFKQWAGSTLLIKLFDIADSGGNIDEAVDSLDSRLDDSFGKKHSEKVQHRFVDKVLLPMAKRLMHEDMQAYKTLLGRHYTDAS